MARRGVGALVASGLVSHGALALAADYYVDSMTGEDTNPGTMSQPWEHCPGMGGWAASQTLAPGDVVYFNSGSTWQESSGEALLIVTGGVTYDGATWGSGTRATFRAGASLNAYGDSLIRFAADDGTHETVVRGFEVDLDGHAASGIVINRYGPSDLIGATKRIADCVVHSIDPGSMRYGILVGADASRRTEHAEILDNVVHDTPRSGILCYEQYQGGTGHVSDATYRGNTVFAAGLLGSGTAGAGIDIKNDCNDIIVEQNYVYDNKIGIMVANDNGYPGPNHVEIRHNMATGNSQAGIVVDNAGDKNATIYGNVVHDNAGPGLLAWSTLWGTIDLRVFNNTFYRNAG